MSISARDRELVAVGISIAAGCKPCTDFHIKCARKAKATDDDIKRAIGHGAAVRRAATDIMENYGLAHFGAERESKPHGKLQKLEPVETFTRIGAAFAVNCVSSLKQHLADAEQAGIVQDDISQIVTLAAFIKAKANSHVEPLVSASEEEAVQAPSAR